MTSTSWNGSDEFWKRAEQSGTRSNDHCAGHEEAGMRNAEIYTWSDDYDAEGMKLPVASTSTSEPKRVDIPSAEIVDIVAGEHAFYALDNLGRIHAWGQLRKGKTLHRTGFSDARKHTDRPILLNFPGPEPTRIQSIKTGGSIMLALDSNAQIWTFTSWGRPYRLISPLLPFSPSSSSSSPSSTSTPQTRIACSSTGKFCLALLPTGSLFIWYPHSSRWSAALEYANCDFEEQIEERDELRCRASNSISNGNGDGVGVVNCWTWEMEMDPDVLPDIPVDLPFLRWEGELGDEGVRLVDVDVGDGFVVGVTNWGHVLLLRVGENGAIGGWRYLPEFSERNRIKMAALSRTIPLQGADIMKITNVIAHGETFIAYSRHASFILLSSIPPYANSLSHPPSRPPSHNPTVLHLPHHQIHSASLGDNQLLVLTTTGELYIALLPRSRPNTIPKRSNDLRDCADLRMDIDVDEDYRYGVPHRPIVTTTTDGRDDPGGFRRVDLGEGLGVKCCAATAAGTNIGVLLLGPKG